MARALPRRAKVSVRDRLRLPDGLRAFAQGSYIVSLRWRSGCPCGHQFYMPPVGSENLYSRTSPDGKQANRPAGISLAPKARFYGSPAAGGHIYSSPRSGDTTTLGPKGPVKPENPPANGRSILRTFPSEPFEPSHRRCVQWCLPPPSSRAGLRAIGYLLSADPMTQKANPVTQTLYSSPDRAIPQPSA